MLKKTITYEDFNNETVSEDFYFHLSKAELIELEMRHEGGLSEALKRIVAANDGKTIISEFKNIILTSYGQRSSDGRRFIKNQIMRDEFESSEAYSTLFVELVTNAEAAAAFVNGIVPSGIVEDIAKMAESQPSEPSEAKPELTVVLDPEVLSRQQLIEMPQDEFLRVWAPRIQKGEVVVGDN